MYYKISKHTFVYFMNKNITEKEIFDVPLESIYNGLESMRLLEESSRVLGEVNNFATGAVEYDFIIETLKNIEALTSSRIEGTTGNLKDLYAEEALSFKRKSQLKLFSAINYKVAIGDIENILKKYTEINMLLMRHVHKILTENDPATKGVPGSFRKKDVMITNSILGDFYPASYLKVEDFMERYVKESATRKKLPVLLNAAISHYQFESIHPFEDGNGRTGRMLIVMDLLLGQALKVPMLNLSQYFESHRDEYIKSLRSVTIENSYYKWISFFLEAVKSQSIHNIKLIDGLRKIEEEDKKIVNAQIHSPVAALILHHALNGLYITVIDTEQYLKKQNVVSADLTQVARTNISRLVEEGILAPEDFKFGRSNVYAHKKLREHLLRKKIDKV